MLSDFFNVFKKKNKNNELDFDLTIEENNEIVNKISPDSIEVGENFVRSGTNYTRKLICVDFEPLLNQNDIRMLSELSETITVTQHLEIYDMSKVRSELSQSIRQNRAKLDEPKISPDVEQDAIAQIESANS